MEIRNNLEYTLGTTIVHIETKGMSIVATSIAQSDEEVHEVITQAIAKSFSDALRETFSNMSSADRLLFGLAHAGEEADSAKVNVIKPSIQSIITFVNAIYRATKSGKMDEVDSYEKGVCPLPKEVKDYIKELISK